MPKVAFQISGEKMAYMLNAGIISYPSGKELASPSSNEYKWRYRNKCVFGKILDGMYYSGMSEVVLMKIGNPGVLK